MKQVRGFGADILHMQHVSMWFNVGLSLNRHLRVVLTVHDAVPHPGDRASRKTPYFFWKLGYRRANRIIVHNRHVQTLLERNLGLVDKSIQIIPYIQIGHAKPCNGGESGNGQNVLFFGRIWPYKGLEYLIRAEPLVTERIPSVKFVIAGVGENLERYQAQMVHPERFLVLNRYIAEEEAAQLFQNASVVALPYIEASQSFIISEAYTYGKPVVATTVGGLPEMVVHGETGLLVPPRDEQQLANAIVTLLGNDELRRKMGRDAKEFLQRNCSAAMVAQKTMDVYRSVAVGLAEKERYE
jgi:glycosyltransferase involved in cell wall biosynthesis